MIPRLPRMFAWCLALATVATAIHAAEPQTVQREITRLEQESNDAYAANNLPKYFGYYAEDVALIFNKDRMSLANYRTFWTKAIKTEPIESVKISDLLVRVLPSNDTAIASYQIDVRTRHADGKITEEHSFETDVWLNTRGAWKIVHVQYSAIPAT